MKLVIIEGKFNRFSDSSSSNGRNYVDFIEVDGKRYLNVVWSNHMANFMREAIGKQVRISFGKIGRNLVVGALEYDNKVEKEPRKNMFGYNELGTIGMLLAILACSIIGGAMASYFVAGWFFTFMIGLGVLQWVLMPLRRSRIADALDRSGKSPKTA